MCIDACPVGALTSGTYRYKTRPWEMNHVATICTHCGDGCKTTLGVRSVQRRLGDRARRQSRQVRHQRRLPLQQGPLRVRLRQHAERLTQPLVRQANGELEARQLGRGARPSPATSSRELRDTRGGTAHRRHRLQPHDQRRELPAAEVRAHGARHQQHRPPPHRRLSSPSPSALPGTTGRSASQRDIATAPAILLVGGDPTNQAPADRLESAHQRSPQSARASTSRITAEIKLRRQAKAFRPGRAVRLRPLASLSRRRRRLRERASGIAQADELSSFRDAVRGEENLVVLGSATERRDGELARLINDAAQREVCLPRRLRQLARRLRHGPAARHAPRLPVPLVDGSGAFAAEYSAADGARPRHARDVRRRERRQSRRALRRRLESRRALRRRPQTRCKTPSSSCRICSSPRPPRSPTLFCPPRFSTRSPAPSPTATAICSS